MAESDMRNEGVLGLWAFDTDKMRIILSELNRVDRRSPQLPLSRAPSYLHIYSVTTWYLIIPHIPPLDES